MITLCTKEDFQEIFQIINDAAQAYKGVIPADRWQDPYMPQDALQSAIERGVVFWGYKEQDCMIGVMGIQDIDDVTLIRHAYVRTENRNQGIGSRLLKFLTKKTDKPVLIGTWAAASWAIKFYQKHGFRLVSESEKNLLLKKYWSIPDRQVETSVVLVDTKWDQQNNNL